MSILGFPAACTSRGIGGIPDENESASASATATATADDDDAVEDAAMVESSSGSTDDETEDPSIPTADTQWLLAIATIVDPPHPSQWYVIGDWEDGELRQYHLQSLSLEQGSTTTPRELVGESFVPTDMAVIEHEHFDTSISCSRRATFRARQIRSRVVRSWCGWRSCSRARSPTISSVAQFSACGVEN